MRLSWSHGDQGHFPGVSAVALYTSARNRLAGN